MLQGAPIQCDNIDKELRDDAANRKAAVEDGWEEGRAESFLFYLIGMLVIYAEQVLRHKKVEELQSIKLFYL